jgi:hypothetical protein
VHGTSSKVCILITNGHTYSLRYFCCLGRPLLTTEDFPFDVDTTSLALTILDRDKELISSVMDEMLDYVDSDGIIQVGMTSHIAVTNLD